MEAALEKLHFDLMCLEMQLVEQLDEIAKDFERNISDLFTSLQEQVQSQYPLLCPPLSLPPLSPSTLSVLLSLCPPSLSLHPLCPPLSLHPLSSS